MKRRGGVADGILGLGVLLVVPAVLAVTFGLHVPRAPHDAASATTDVATLAWILWAWCAFGLVVDVTRRLRGTPKAAARSGMLDPLAAGLVGLIMSVGALLPSSISFADPAVHQEPAPAVLAATTTATASTQSLSSFPAVLYKVQPGDDLWSIAEHLYGDGDAWNLLAGANLGSTMNDGRLFVDPSVIQPGWTLRAPVPEGPPPRVAPPLPARSEIAPLDAATGPSTPTASSTQALAAHSWVWLTVGLGTSTVAALLLRRARRTRRPRPEVIDLAIGLERLAVSPLLTLTERAILLAGTDGVLSDLCLLFIDADGAVIRNETGALWHATVEELTREDELPLAAHAIVAPLGSTDEAEMSLLIPAGSAACIGGADAEALFAQTWQLQQSFTWGPLISRDSDADGRDRPVDLDPIGLHISDGRRSRAPGAAVLEVADESIDDVDVTVGNGWLTLPNFDVELEWWPISGVLRPDEDDDHASLVVSAPEAQQPISHDGHSREHQVMVRILCSQPSLQGLVEPLDPKRARRATEVVAYLALHRPEDVTGDRIRTRVLGSSTRDAATKTLFNVASAARRALGTMPDGSPVLPTASRSGCYRAGDAITTDLDVLEAHLEAADGAADRDERLAHLRAAIELVESEPLGAVLAGWEWFVPEGHRARLERAVESAAVSLALDAAASGHPALVDLAIERARLVLPYSERLAIAAMEAASLLGDIDGVRRAFGDLGTIVDELDPGAWPVPALEELFSELARAARERSSSHASLAAIDDAPLSTSPSAPAAL